MGSGKHDWTTSFPIKGRTEIFYVFLSPHGVLRGPYHIASYAKMAFEEAEFDQGRFAGWFPRVIAKVYNALIPHRNRIGVPMR